MDVTWSMWWTIGVIAAAVFVAFVAFDIWLLMRSRSSRMHANDRGDQRLVPRSQNADGSSRGHDGAEDAAMRARRERVRSYDVHPLSDDERDRYVERWRLVQGEFVANPADAVSRADELVVAVMMAEGYPGSSNPDTRAEDLEVDYPGAAESYRWAHNALMVSRTRNLQDEDYRNAMMQYGRVFDALAPDRRSPVIGGRRPGLSANI